MRKIISAVTCFSFLVSSKPSSGGGSRVVPDADPVAGSARSVASFIGGRPSPRLVHVSGVESSAYAPTPSSDLPFETLEGPLAIPVPMPGTDAYALVSAPVTSDQLFDEVLSHKNTRLHITTRAQWDALEELDDVISLQRLNQVRKISIGKFPLPRLSTEPGVSLWWAAAGNTVEVIDVDLLAYDGRGAGNGGWSGAILQNLIAMNAWQKLKKININICFSEAAAQGIYLAAKHGNLPALKAFLTADLGTHDEKQRIIGNAVMYATYFDKLVLVKQLLRNAVHPKPNALYESFLIAVYNKSIEMMAYYTKPRMTKSLLTTQMVGTAMVRAVEAENKDAVDWMLLELPSALRPPHSALWMARAEAEKRGYEAIHKSLSDYLEREAIKPTCMPSR